MLSSFFKEIKDIFEEYHNTLGFKLYLAVIFSTIPTLYIILNILCNNKIDPIVYFLLLASIETFLYYIMPFRFYQNNFGQKISFQDPHRYKGNERLDQIHLKIGNTLTYSFKLSFGRKVIEYLEKDRKYKIKFKKPRNVKIVPIDKISSDEKWHDHPNEPFFSCVYDMDIDRVYYFKMSTTSKGPHTKEIAFIFEYNSKTLDIHKETIQIVS